MRDSNLEKKVRQCPGCHVVLPFDENLVHTGQGFDRYGVASLECLSLATVVMAKEQGYWFERRILRDKHCYAKVVDVYAVQHPPHIEYQLSLGINERFRAASIQSVVIHLIALYLCIERKETIRHGSEIMNQVLTARSRLKSPFPELKPPQNRGSITVAVVAKATSFDELSKIVWDWAYEQWGLWAEHHETIRELCKRYSK